VLLSIMSGLLSILLAAIGWWLVNLHDKHERLRAAHEELRVEVAGQFLKKDEIREMFSEFKRDLTELIERATGKGRE